MSYKSDKVINFNTTFKISELSLLMMMINYLKDFINNLFYLLENIIIYSEIL